MSMSLQDEIVEKSSQIFRDSYQMSIGELINLYKDDEMDIHPEFQRLFRWSEYQKTKLIESIMLNIPIPPVFVSQSDNGVWDIIDGVQRLSTIFQFIGILKNEKGELMDQLTLQKTDYLPSFAGMKWDGDIKELSFTKEQQLYFKRARLDVTIMKKESDPNTKYELFQRLNTGGTLLSDQEVRNCLMIMANKIFYEFVEEIAKTTDYQNSIPISDRKSDEQYRMELILRLLVAFEIDWDKIGEYKDFSNLLDKEVLKICAYNNYPYEEKKQKFLKTFGLLYGILGEDVFKKYNGTKHTGPFLNSAYQTISCGIYNNIDTIISMDNHSEWLLEKVRSLYEQDVFIKNTTPGARAIPRYKELSLFGMEFFKL